MNPVTLERTRTCIRCHERFTEPAGTITRICDDCPGRRTATPLGADGESIVNRSRERTCIRCGDVFIEDPGEISRLCQSCDPDHVLLD